MRLLHPSESLRSDSLDTTHTSGTPRVGGECSEKKHCRRGYGS
jgi:hypothetical protein